MAEKLNWGVNCNIDSLVKRIEDLIRMKWSLMLSVYKTQTHMAVIHTYIQYLQKHESSNVHDNKNAQFIYNHLCVEYLLGIMLWLSLFPSSSRHL